MGQRAAIALLVLSGCAVAEVGPPPRADISRMLYLNDCMPSGCLLVPGNDNARLGRSSIVPAPTKLEAFSWGPTEWRELVSCVQRAYAPFDLVVTDEDPGDMPHFELVIGGSPSDLKLGPNAGGVAPAQCPNQLEDEDVAFVFASRSSDVDELCWVAAQESGHMFGLDHERDDEDPMAWTGPAAKPGFQDREVACGEYGPRWCNCDRASQNSYAMLMDTLGPAVVLY